MKLIESLNWRYATKRFDPDRKVSQEDVERILESVRLSASSYGLQPYKILVIEDEDTREELKAVSFDQKQITEASHLFVFCNRLPGLDEVVDEFMQLKTDSLGLQEDKLNAYGKTLKGNLAKKSESEQADWTARQAYIALGHLLIACAELRIDACPMEGFDPKGYDKVLGLRERGLKAAVIAAVGYRSPEDPAQHSEKIRKPVDELFEMV